jgi:D-methionine transport system ATP-binding protein
LIRDINKKLGITVVIITHQMSVVEEVCTHVAILDRGEVAEVGTVGAVFSSPKSAAGRRLVFPNGEDDMVSDPAKEKRLRVVFNGAETAGAPLITTMAIETGIAVNILAASIRSIESRAYGSMLLGIPGKRENIFTVTDYLQAVSDVYVEEV